MAELNGVGHTAEMQTGEPNQFDVLAAGETIFSKQRQGRWPEVGEILAALPPV